ncbi:helix-turn-helix domain-containing protein [Streptomyces sp. H27-S2]|uniref:helix-turn-helix domain-containing protein n=1 Tax=Streptomyces antarcticus TaxID=2996458 RepID=UPI002270B5C9|nr:helix-turn-helix domain-containing protein [Streptomyces sp. H27-S2]MCY0955046.1 helix-turn-helix domain-containing protein [Streptomyces sp. H27-S2]
MYRLYDAEERLLYVGITMNLQQRLTDHRRQKFWWHLVKQQDVRWYDSRPKAESIEAEALRTEGPLYDGTDRITNWVHARQSRPVDPFWRPVAEALLSQITNGTCLVGSRLPAARELADRFKISESSAGFALHMLRTARVIGVAPHNVVRPIGDHQPLGQTDAEVRDRLAEGDPLERTATAPPSQSPCGVSFRDLSIMRGCAMPDPDRLRQVDALLDGLDDVLPPPHVRAQLRLAAGLTQKDVADVVGVKRVAVARWESGEARPRRPHREVYLHLLNGLAERFPEAAQLDEGMPTPTSEGGSG